VEPDLAVPGTLLLCSNTVALLFASAVKGSATINKDGSSATRTHHRGIERPTLMIPPPIDDDSCIYGGRGTPRVPFYSLGNVTHGITAEAFMHHDSTSDPT
jgi:hypothetical protein